MFRPAKYFARLGSSYKKIVCVLMLFWFTVSCSSASAAKTDVWGMEPETVRMHLQKRELKEIQKYLSIHQNPEIMQEALLLGQDSLYTIALIFASEKMWGLYRRAMMVQSYLGSPSGKTIALEYMKSYKIFTKDDILQCLQKYLEQEPGDHAQVIFTATLALDQGKVDLAQKYWLQFLKLRQHSYLTREQAQLGLKLALLQRDRLAANKYMRKMILDFPSSKIHTELQKDLTLRSEWLELLRTGQEGPQLLQALDWKVALLQRKFSATLPILFSEDVGKVDTTTTQRNLKFWWDQHILVEDSGRAMIAANNYRSQSRNVENGRKHLQSLLQRNPGTNQETYKDLAYWYIRNKRTYANMERYRSTLQKDPVLSSRLLVEYLYFFLHANRWQDLPQFLKSWHTAKPKDQRLNSSSIRLFKKILRDMSARKRSSLLREIYLELAGWGNEELALESAWNYRLAKGKPLSQKEWQQLSPKVRMRTLGDIRLFVLRADQGESLLPKLPTHEVQKSLTPEQQDLHDLFSQLLDNNFADEALRLARLYHNELAASSIVDFSRRIQAQGEYDTSMRMVAQLTYDDNYRMSREALELYYPKVFYPLMSSFSKKYRLPLPIFYGLVRQESYFAPAVVSHAGAVGLSQLMPATMREVAGKIGYRNPDATDPATNLKIGSYYLRYLIDHRWTNDFAQALMAYNAGLGNIRRWKARYRSHTGLEFNNTIPIRETRLYVQKISAGAIYYSELYGWGNSTTILHTIYPTDFPVNPALSTRTDADFVEAS